MADKFVGRMWLEELGFKGIDMTPMNAQIEKWWGWFTATCDFYDFEETSVDGKRHFRVKRISIQPAKMVCEDWAAILMNERTLISVGTDKEDDESMKAANNWLQDWLAKCSFIDNGNRLIERITGLGTGGWALKVKGINADNSVSPDARIIPQQFDVRHIIPLTFDDTGACTECLFRSETRLNGKTLTQLQVYMLGKDGTYDIYTAFFNGAGARVQSDKHTELFHTHITTPPFALARPGLDNVYWEFSPFGVSVFDRALGAVELVDMAVDNLNRDIYLGQKMVGIPSYMLGEDDKGNAVVPRAKDQQFIIAMEEADHIDAKPESGIWEYTPDLRVDDNRLAIKTALELLGKRVGLGADYYSLDDGDGRIAVKTATEVASDNTELMRNAKKHEASLAPAIKTICTAAIELAGVVQGRRFPDVKGHINVQFGDTIIEDDNAVRTRERADVAAGLLAGWKYIAKWYGETDEDAKDLWAENNGSLPAEEI